MNENLSSVGVSPQPQPIKPLFRWSALAALVLFLGVLSWGVFIYFPNQKLSGSLYLTLKPNDPKNSDQLGLYTYNFDSGKLLNIDPEPSWHPMTSKVSPDGKNLAYSALSSDTITISGKSEDFRINQIYLLPNGTSSPRKLTRSTSTISKRLPSWSLDGRNVTFTASSPNLFDLLFTLERQIPENWSVYTVTVRERNGDVNEQFIDSGSAPVFVTGDTIVFMKNDGLYAYDINLATTTRIYPVSNARLSQKFVFSLKNSLFAFSDAQKDVVIIYQVKNWKPFEYEEIDRIKGRVYGMVFSPDGSHLAAVEAYNVEPKASQGSELTTYKLAHGGLYAKIFSVIPSLRRNVLYSLSNFEQEYIWLTDWQ